MSEKRKVIIHKHIFKNAGTTFDWSLKNSFGTAFCDHRDDKDMQRGREAYLIDFLMKNPEVRALSSHAIRFSPPKHDELELIPVYLIRHPIERIRSVYNFEHLQPPVTLGAKMAKNMNLKEYVAWRMREDVPATIRNFQTRVLGDIRSRQKITDDDFRIALEELETSEYIGVVDRYDDSMKVFQHLFDKIGIQLDLSYIPQNVYANNHHRPIQENAKDVLYDLGKLAQKTIENNQFDLEIYNRANLKLTNKLKGLKTAYS